ncbi:MAG: T9SS type A sorting domain-containing protein, partial [Bacteroidetes bacterium]|nr:T9SS type A sorting domain-containing protein [Bacteroidota bacterium]
TVNFFRDFLIKQLGCTDPILQAENSPSQSVYLYPINYCDGTPVDEVCSSSFLNEESIYSALIYPNPSNGVIQIIPNKAGIYSVEIMDYSGRILHSSYNNSSICEMNLEILCSGNYLIKVSTDSYSFTKSLLKY